MWKLVVGLVVVAFGGGILYATSPYVRGRVLAATWDGASPLSCSPGQVIALRGKSIKVSAGTALSAAGDCRLELDDCSVDATRAISVGGDAQVTVRGGRVAGAVDAAGNSTLTLEGVVLEAKPVALTVSGNAHATVRGGAIRGGLVAVVVDGDAKADVSAPLDGAVRVEGNGRLTGSPALDRAQSARDLSARWAAHACDAVVPCYARAAAWGNVAGRLTAAITGRGTASDAGLDRCDAPPAVRECLLASARHARLDGYDGAPGKLRCQWAGSLLPGTRRMSWEPSFTVDE